MSFFSQYPAVGGGSANASVGTNGAIAPTSSTEVAGVNPSGNLQPLQTDASGNLLVNLNAESGAPLHVIVDSSALPTGAATSANQVTGNSSLSTIATNTTGIATAANQTNGTQQSQIVQGGNTATVTASNALKVDGSAVTQPVSALALPLPSNAAQETGGHLASLDTKLPAQGQALAAASLPVVLPAAQITALTPPTTVTVTQATGTNLHTVIDSGTVTATISGTPNVAVTSSALPAGAATSALQTSVQGSAAGGTAATSSQLGGGIYNSALPTLTTGQQAATQVDSSGRLIVVSPGVPTSLGQQAAATSQPVALANEDVQDLYITGQAAQTALINNILPATAGTAATDVTGYRSFAVQVTSTGTAGAFIFETSNDNVNFVPVPVYSTSLLTGVPLVAAITASASNIVYAGSVTGRYLRLRISTAITGGSIQAFSKMSQTSFSPAIQSVAQGTASSLQATVTIASGTVSAVTAITNALPAGTNVIGLVRQGGFTLSNAPVQNVYSTTNVTTAAYVQLIASTTAATNWVDIFDSSGQAMIIATGASGSEVPFAYIPPGGDSFSYAIPISTRISVKALTATANSGYLLLNLRA